MSEPKKIKNSGPFLYVNNKHIEKGIRETMPIKMASNFLGINQIKEVKDLYNKSF